MSDGFSCVATDANGVYQMPRHADAFHVFYRIPADREIPMSGGPSHASGSVVSKTLGTLRTSF